MLRWNMADSDDDDNHPPKTTRERIRSFEGTNIYSSDSRFSRPSPIRRSFTAPDNPPPRRPQISHLTSTSEEIIQRTVSGFLNFTEKGRATLQQTGNSVNDFTDRVFNPQKGGFESRPVSGLQSPVDRDSGKSYIGVSDDEGLGDSSGEEEELRSPGSSTPSSQRDRREIETQLSDYFANFKMISRSAFSTVSGVTSPLKSGFDTASSNAKAMTEKMSEDLRDYANHTKGSSGMCSRCEKFPTEKDWKAKHGALDLELTFETPLERILYHSDWCRLCGFFLRHLCRPEHDPFRHPQIGPHLQPHLKGKSFGDFVDSGVRYTDSHWPFGYGQDLQEGAFNYLDPVALKHRYKKQAVASHLIPMMMKAATNANKSGAPASDADFRERRTRLADSKQQETAPENLVHPLKCVLKVTIKTSVDPLRSGQVQVSLLGYGRGSAAKLATLSQFPLRVQSEPSFGSSKGPLRYGNLLDNAQIDLSMGALWLHECEAHHGSHCSEQSWSNTVQAPPSLRLIDVQRNNIVIAHTIRDLRFVALSYVWGIPAFETLKLTSSNLHQLSQISGLKEYWHGVSTTVKDAMAVVRAMGERYLWVDALCIIQDVDDEEKTQQIAAMDWLYSKALLTIVAADAQNSMSGLAGARPASRNVKQHAIQIRAGTRLLAPLEAPTDLDKSVWNSRAWTLQERFLSRRLLIFQGGQMLWHCRTSTAHEDMTPADKGVDYPLLTWLTLQKQNLGTDGKENSSIMVFPDKSTRIVRSSPFHQYSHLISQYTSRHLTHEDDILHAFTGLLHLFRQSFKFPLRYGLPEILFDVALLWQPAEMLEERDSEEKFPSWSWAGWKGKVKYEEPFIADCDGFLGTLTRVPKLDDGEGREERIRPLVRWYVRNKSISSPNPNTPSPTEILTPLNKTGLGVPLFPSKTKPLPAEWSATPFPTDPKNPSSSTQEIKTSHLPPTLLATLQPHHLLFRTLSISTFRLGTPLTQPSDTRYNPSNPPLRFNILSSRNRNVGTVLLDGEGPHTLNSNHVFVVVSEGQYYGLDVEPGGVKGFPLFNVLLLEVMGGEGSVILGRRLGVGRVDKGGWGREGGRRVVVCLE